MTRPFESAQQLLKKGQTALCLFTDGKHLEFNGDGSGSTGHWIINPKRKIDQVIIYQQSDGQATVFIAEPDGYYPTKEGRYTLNLLRIEEVGTTNRSWKEFAAIGQNPVRYLIKKII